jgi:NAD(P)-dependent dehydrogenase (short-subunit alcohol dehydrogenase family)
MASQRLKGKVVLVSGASRGIGLAIAELCASEGAILVLVARRSRALAEAARRIRGQPLVLPADITQPQEANALFRRVQQRFGRLDVLVNSAGVFTFKPFRQTTLEDWRANLESNLTSLYLTTRAALPLLRRSRGPHIVNILSVASRQAFPNCSAYCAAKFGALGFTSVLREELRPRIRVTAVLPGPTNTRMIREFGFPVRRASLVQPGDVAQAVLTALLLAPRASADEIVVTPSRGKL